MSAHGHRIPQLSRGQQCSDAMDGRVGVKSEFLPPTMPMEPAETPVLSVVQTVLTFNSGASMLITSQKLIKAQKLKYKDESDSLFCRHVFLADD